MDWVKRPILDVFCLKNKRYVEKNSENIQNIVIHCGKDKKKTKRHCKMIRHDV
ncbi:MAG: hypothetical protein IJZ55_10435 [Lachnospiraceae bacterium]|nr:hypothetical protein [Lachnospiraceae bacterium]